MDYRNVIHEKYEDLSKTQQRIADFILRNYVEVSWMKAHQLAEATHCDTTNVVRFAQRLGYIGWPELQESIICHARAEFRARQGIGIHNVIDVLRQHHSTVEALLEDATERLQEAA